MKFLIGLLCLVCVSCSSLTEPPPEARASLQPQAVQDVRVLALIPCLRDTLDPAILVRGTSFRVTDYFGDTPSAQHPALGVCSRSRATSSAPRTP
jgi:hypothetical protein